ncbi:MAG: hypothetical protein H6514_19940 [Acidimicrobiaceae bacterium]|nr:hypothetical protein [Acidimicrobiaceae bacterium]
MTEARSAWVPKAALELDRAFEARGPLSSFVELADEHVPSAEPATVGIAAAQIAEVQIHTSPGGDRRRRGGNCPDVDARPYCITCALRRSGSW